MILTIISFALIFTAIVVIHELGHFLFARLFKVRILAFGIGFGPAIYKKKTASGMDFKINLFPLGGYVRMDGEDPTEIDESVSAEKRKGFYYSKTAWQRFLIALAGPAFSILAGYLLLLTLKLKHNPAPESDQRLSVAEHLFRASTVIDDVPVGGHRHQQAVTLAIGQAGGIDVVALGRADSALIRQHPGHRFAGHQFGLVDRLGRATLHQRRTARVAELLRVGQQFVLDQLLQPGLAAEDGDDALELLRQLVLFAADLHFFQPRELLQAGVKDVVGLFLAQAEARDQLRRRSFRR